MSQYDDSHIIDIQLTDKGRAQFCDGQPLPGFDRLPDCLQVEIEKLGIEKLGQEMLLEFECKTCHKIFESEMGAISFATDPPTFQHKPICPQCGERTLEEVLLTEIGQGQLTEAFMRT